MEIIILWLARYFAQPDKALHFVGGVIIGAIVAASGAAALGLPTLACSALGSLVGALAAWAKERRDKADPQHHTWDGWDAYATSLGAIIGAHLGPLLLAGVTALA